MNIDNKKIEYCREEEDYFIDTEEGRYYLNPDDILAKLNGVKENELLHSVSGSSVDLGNDLYNLIDRYISEGLSEYHVQCRLNFVVGRVDKNYR